MARRKADELEDFSPAPVGDGAKAEEHSTEEVEEGSQLLKEMLKKWKEEVQAGNMTKAEKAQRMRELVKADDRLMGNKFFQSIKTL
jgi:DNA mismatch repair protein MSH2